MILHSFTGDYNEKQFNLSHRIWLIIYNNEQIVTSYFSLNRNLNWYSNCHRVSWGVAFGIIFVPIILWSPQVLFLWTTRSQKQYEWMIDILREVEASDKNKIIRIHIFITQFKSKFDLRTIMLVSPTLFSLACTFFLFSVCRYKSGCDTLLFYLLKFLSFYEYLMILFIYL